MMRIFFIDNIDMKDYYIYIFNYSSYHMFKKKTPPILLHTSPSFFNFFIFMGGGGEREAVLLDFLGKLEHIY